MSRHGRPRATRGEPIVDGAEAIREAPTLRARQRRELARICDDKLTPAELRVIGEAFELAPEAMIGGIDDAWSELRRQHARGSHNGELGAAVTVLGRARRVLDDRRVRHRDRPVRHPRNEQGGDAP